MFTYRGITVRIVLERSSDDFREGLLVSDDLMEDLGQGDPVTVVVTEEAGEERPTQGILHSKGVLLIFDLQVGTYVCRGSQNIDDHREGTKEATLL